MKIQFQKTIPNINSIKEIIDEIKLIQISEKMFFKKLIFLNKYEAKNKPLTIYYVIICYYIIIAPIARYIYEGVIILNQAELE